MKYRELLLFVGKCLTLGHYPERIVEVRDIIRSGAVEWEKIVWITTNHFVFPAFYLQLKRAGLILELPADLVEYMEEFTQLNRERNQHIIEQAHEITQLLNQHGISPLFLKGTAHLLDGLYTDIAERMVGDIDLLVNEEDMITAAEILMGVGYEPLASCDTKTLKILKHYPRLKNDNRSSAVELHRQILHFPYYKSIDSKELFSEGRKLNHMESASVLSNQHQIIHNILNVQFNDKGYYYAHIFLRQSYDLLLLSQRANPLVVVQDFGKFSHTINANLALTNHLLGNPSCIAYRTDWQTRMFIRRINMNLSYHRWEHFSHLVLFISWKLSRYHKLMIRSLYDRDVRHSLYARLCNPKWYGAHLKSYRKVI